MEGAGDPYRAALAAVAPAAAAGAKAGLRPQALASMGDTPGGPRSDHHSLPCARVLKCRSPEARVVIIAQAAISVAFHARRALADCIRAAHATSWLKSIMYAP